MKVRFIFSLLTALFIAGSVFAESELLTPKKYTGPKIVLKGEIGTETGRSAIPLTPIEAILGDDNLVHIIFEAPIGTVQILVDGQVVETCEVTSVEQEAAFSVEGWAPGAYKLEFKTPKGGYVCGEFTIEE